MTESIKAKYVGDGNQFFNDIPMRDLTNEDWDALDDEQKARVANSGIYNVVGVKPAAPVVAPAPVEESAPA